jgi:hypothetical protein
MDSITLSFDTYTNAGGTSVTGDTQAYDVLGVRGLDNPDEIGLWPALSNQLLDGSQSQTNLKARRIITVDFGVIVSKRDRVWLMSFMLAPVKELVFAGDAESPAETVEVVLEAADGFQNEWLDGLSMARAFTLRFVEKTPWADVPTAFGDAGA